MRFASHSVEFFNISPPTPGSVEGRGDSHTFALLQFALWALLSFPVAGGMPAANASNSEGAVPSAQNQTTRNPHGPLTIPCENCHTAAGWRPIRTVPEFDHNKTKYPLRGLHEKVACTLCHVKPVFTDVGKNCADCHADIHRRQFGPNCAQCHTVQGWDVATQQVKNHQNRFPLFGAHSAVQCSECHKGAATGIYFGLSTECSSCHLKEFQQTTNPNHVAAKFSTKCDTCHNFDSWLGAKFDHSTTGFLLTNGHANVPCASCHIDNNYNLQIAPTDCGNSGCHLTMWQHTTTPVHSTSGPAFAASNCANCHTTQGWDAASFDHSITGFPLTGTHKSPTPTPCASCHVNNNYTLNSAECMTCHTTDWNKTQTLGGSVPNHITAGFPSTASACAGCHPITTWADGKFDHSAIGFPLTNGHANVPCASCHINGNYNLKIAPTDCGNAGCHLTTWQQTNNPVHSTSGAAFAASNCVNCHTTKGWDAASFDHSVTGFTLTGTHTSPTPTPCASCHVSNNYTLNSTDCMGCHQSAWNSTQTLGGNVPNHVAANFPTSASACSSCHTITVWADGKFDHSTTGFPLTNSHQMAPAGKVTACTQCHVGGNYNLTSTNTDCYGCHQTAWTSTQTLGGNVPNHVSAGFPTSLCSQCHDTITWTDSTFNHSNTGFTLTGTHATTACALCHVNNNYSLTSANTDCMGCHLAAWNSTQTLGGNVPNHVSANFPTTAAACSGCHTITVWADGKFDHSTTGWALTGAHQMAPAGKVTACTQCHLNGNYTLTAANTACYGCHLADWNSTQTLGGSVPNHVAASFPTTCDTCHTTTSWLGATFNHTWFPIPHGGEPTNPPCNDCHQVSTDFSSFTCINCHTQTAHQQSQTNSNHQGVSGYVYNATSCYGCHKSGGGG
jgi:hypothetical protein